MISYHIKDLTVPSPEAVALQIEWIASRLGLSTVELTIPLNATECPKLPFAPVAGNQVVFQDGVQLPCSPPAWGVSAAHDQNSHQSMLQVLYAASG
jgi:hypothetical protein